MNKPTTASQTALATQNILFRKSIIRKGMWGKVAPLSTHLRKTTPYKKNRAQGLIPVKFPGHPAFFCQPSQVNLLPTHPDQAQIDLSFNRFSPCPSMGAIACHDCPMQICNDGDDCDMKAGRTRTLYAFHYGFVAGHKEWPGN